MSAPAAAIGAAQRKRARVMGWEEQLFALAIVIVSVMDSPLMQAQLAPLPGFKTSNIVFGLAFLAFLQIPGRRVPTDRLGRIVLFSFVAYIAFFLVDFLRSVPHYPAFHALSPKSSPATLDGFAESYFLVPLLFACTFLYVLLCLCSNEGIKLVLRAISLGSFLVSVTVIVAISLHPDALFDTSPTRDATLKVVNDALALHYNTVGSMLATVAPLLLYMALKRGSFWTANYALALTAVLMLKSRTGLLTFCGISAITMVVLGRARVLVAAAPIVVMGALAALGPVLIRLLSIGFTKKSGLSLDMLLSGREQAIWTPLLFEWFKDPQRLFFGEGLSGIKTSNILYSGLFFPAGEAHDVYLEFFLDNGIFLFAVFVCGLAAWIVWSTRMARRLNNGLFWVLYLCVISFLVTGFTSRHYFPNPDDGDMFPIIATLINVARMKVAQKEGMARTGDGNGSAAQGRPQ